VAFIGGIGPLNLGEGIGGTPGVGSKPDEGG
jgi:hypothetical protein